MKSTTLSFVILLIVARNCEAQTDLHFLNDTVSVNTLVASSFINDQEGWIADNTGLLWHTDNAGATWTSISTGKYFLKLAFINHLDGYSLTSDFAYKTVDGGNSWNVLTMPGSIGKAIYFLNKDTGFISAKHGIYKTNDGGNNWTTFPSNSASITDYYFLNNAVGIAAASDEENSESIWRTIDGGTNWSGVFIKENYFFNSVWFSSDSLGWVAGYYDQTGRGKMPVINQSTDGGVSWKNVYINREPGDEKGEEFLDIRFRNEQQGIAISSYSENVITLNGGLTWNLTYTSVRDLIPSYGIYKFLDGFQNIYLVGRKGFLTSWQ